jgi:hypothetical protein
MRKLWPGCLFLVTAILSGTCQAQSPAGSPVDAEWPLVSNSIIRLMDDRRPLPLKRTIFINSHPKAFEEISHYGPKVVVDALATVLRGMTERSFGEIVSGGSEDERRTVVNAWRVYLHYSTNQSKAGTKPSEPPYSKR